jgi:methyl-accepting chemotaxis protein
MFPAAAYQGVPTESTPFRVVAKNRQLGGTIYLGLSDKAAMHLVDRLTEQFLLVWAGTVFLGFIISYASARATLRRVEHISETVASIGTDDLSSRLPENRSADEISRLSSTFNQMLDRIQASVKQLRTVTDSVAHDMKSPVTAIRGRLEAALSTSDEGHYGTRRVVLLRRPFMVRDIEANRVMEKALD